MKKKFRRFAKKSTAGTKQQKSSAKRCEAYAGRRHGVMMNEELNRLQLNDEVIVPLAKK